MKRVVLRVKAPDGVEVVSAYLTSDGFGLEMRVEKPSQVTDIVEQLYGNLAEWEMDVWPG